MIHLGIPNFSEAKILVFGDLMLDRYWHGNTDRISPEAPVPVVHVKRVEERPGGAGNVALNTAALGVETHLLSIIGQDEAGQLLKEKLQAADIICELHEAATERTITKLRVLSVHQQLIRLDFEDQLSAKEAAHLMGRYQTLLKDMGAVVLSDYGKGTLSEVKALIQQARLAQVPVLIDPKGKDFSIYNGATLLTPNLKEFELVVGPCVSENHLIEKARQLIELHQLEALLITRGANGMTLVESTSPPLHLPAYAREVFDVTGAGDTVIAVAAATLAAEGTLRLGVTLANRAAGIVVGKLGAATVSVAELRRSIRESQTKSRGILTEAELLELRHDAQDSGETIVMTNGCFDILHAGHIAYLQEAKALGNRLIVAVNDDASVKRLKGNTRPIHSLAERMQMLAALEAVDWVVPFSEDTPQRLIETILPDVLVKGGDYQPHLIAGADAVTKNGGEVKVLGFVDGYSTSNLIKKIQQGE